MNWTPSWSGVSYLRHLLEKAGNFLPVNDLSYRQFPVPFIRQSKVSLPYCDANFTKLASQAQAGSLCSSTTASLHNFLFFVDSFSREDSKILNSMTFRHNRASSWIDIDNQHLLLISMKPYIHTFFYVACQSIRHLSWLQVGT